MAVSVLPTRPIPFVSEEGSQFQKHRSCPRADGHAETMKMAEVTPLPNSLSPLPSPQGRGKRGKGERVRGIFKAEVRSRKASGVQAAT